MYTRPLTVKKVTARDHLKPSACCPGLRAENACVKISSGPNFPADCHKYCAILADGMLNADLKEVSSRF
jgi:hypothetical protein